MAQSPPTETQEKTDILSLVLHSKKALQHGELLCSDAHDQTQATTSIGTELLAIEAKAEWLAKGIQEQLRVRATR